MSKLIAAARKYLDTPWRHCGRTASGLDCAGLVWIAYADCGVHLPDRRRYGPEPLEEGGIMDAVVEALGEPVWSGRKGVCKRATLRVGDVLILSPESRPRHVALLGDSLDFGLSLVHADSTPGVMCVAEIGMHQFFLDQIVSVFRRPVE